MIVRLSEDDDAELIKEFNDSISKNSSWVTFDESTILSYGYKENNKLIGTIQMEEWSNNFLGISIASHPDHRREKIASTLIMYMIEVLKQIGYNSQITMTINVDNTPSLKLAESLGFELLKEFPELEVKVFSKQIE